ncbi:NAD(P)H-hydrate dehydratase [Enterococcus timonensis]|uniref:NAD(P)H-hydrate dehydratase n=1 Tax=Enterococcus timonensis TaxID=1852364 RepID=UPI0008DA4658|nr:NAD(P)H-hydrate dehydratase [Enterococcus timonensis]
MEIISENILTKVIQPRPENSHKGTFGRVLLVGGSAEFGGAIILATKACVFAGAGLVTCATDQTVRSSLRCAVPEAMTIDFTDFDSLTQQLKTAEVVVVGPGLSESLKAADILHLVLSMQNENQYLVIDGSAISLFGGGGFELSYPKKVIFTPHAMEWQRLSGLKIKEQTATNNLAAQQKLGALIVLKSHHTQILWQEKILENPLGTPAQATGGMGDTLAGIIASFLGQFTKDWAGQNFIDTVTAAVFIHSYAAERIAANNYVALPTHISELLPQLMHQFSQENKQAKKTESN